MEHKFNESKPLWMNSLDNMGLEQLERKMRDIQYCILSAKTEEQADPYSKQMEYTGKLIAAKKQIAINFDRCTTGHEGAE